MSKVFRPSHCLVVQILIISGTLIAAVAYPVKSILEQKPTGHADEDLEVDVDYPSDTHGGAVKAFSQLISDDSMSGSRSSINRDDGTDNQSGDYIVEYDIEEDESHSHHQDEKKAAKTKSDVETKIIELLEDHDHEQSSSDDSSNDSQYVIEEIYYAYSYEDALSEDDNGDSVDFIDNSADKQ